MKKLYVVVAAGCVPGGESEHEATPYTTKFRIWANNTEELIEEVNDRYLDNGNMESVVSIRVVGHAPSPEGDDESVSGSRQRSSPGGF
jgi:hypothetical protein